MKLSHYSNAIIKPPVRSAVDQPPHPHHKPYGFWLSVDGPEDWVWWCTAEDFGIGRLKHRHEVTLDPKANVLVIDTASGIDKFTRDFGAPLVPGSDSLYIDWSKVVKKYQGAIIAPYQWERRFDRAGTWYYSWDCASGVVWDAAAIAGIEHEPSWQVPARSEAA